MERKMVIGILSVMFFVVLAGCADMQSMKHGYVMRGQILEMTGDTAYLCIGSADGAQVGQEFAVYKFEIAEKQSSAQRFGRYNKVETGRVRITEIVDEHMANAKVISGEAKVHDVVELK
jgi:hypothetical protein